jgi:hypothetical protein
MFLYLLALNKINQFPFLKAFFPSGPKVFKHEFVVPFFEIVF